MKGILILGPTYISNAFVFYFRKPEFQEGQGLRKPLKKAWFQGPDVMEQIQITQKRR